MFRTKPKSRTAGADSVRAYIRKITREVVYTDFRAIPLYVVLGLNDPELTLLSILILMVSLSGILLSSFHPKAKKM